MSMIPETSGCMCSILFGSVGCFGSVMLIGR